jgi:phosphohistidine phosphatase
LTSVRAERTVDPVRILLVRHADAVPESARLPDDHRTLSPVGRQQVRELAALLAESGLHVGAIAASPLVRAVQTAELLARWLDWSGTIEVSHHLVPAMVSPNAAAEWLSASATRLDGAALAAVGHEPSIAHIARLLSGGHGAPPVAAFAKSEACLIEDGVLRWRLEPP